MSIVIRSGLNLSRRLCSTNTMTDLVSYDCADNIRLIGINRREKRNCVNHEAAKQLVAVFEQFENDQSATVAILYGSGGNFCAGYDLSEVQTGSLDFLKEFLQKHRPMGPSMMRFGKPVIAAVEGYAVAGGLELSLMCDLRVADQTAIFGVFCRRFGVPLIDGGTIRLPKLIGLSRAMDMILTGREVRAKEAYEWGLANRLVAHGSAVAEALRLAREISRFPQKCMLADRRSAHYSSYDATSLQDAFDYELGHSLPVVFEESVTGATRFATGGIGKHGSFSLGKGDKSKL